MLRLSEMIEEQKPTMIEFITTLGYTKDEAKKFTEGYMAAVLKMPTLGHKIEAVARMEDGCMTAGFTAARINEEEALARFQEKFLQ